MSDHSDIEMFKGPNDFKVVLTLTRKAAEWLLPQFEIEILRGEKEDLPDGRIEYTIFLDEEKAMILRQAVNMAIVQFNPDQNQN